MYFLQSILRDLFSSKYIKGYFYSKYIRDAFFLQNTLSDVFSSKYSDLQSVCLNRKVEIS